MITVAICTHKRPLWVESCLAALTKQETISGKWEILIVSNDDTLSNELCEIVERAQQLIPVKLILEPKLGLSHARNTALAKASGEFVAFIDDDALASPSWISAIEGHTAKTDVDFIGGPALPLYMKTPPTWFRPEWVTEYDYGDKSRPLTDQESIGGMNFIVRRTLAIELGGFNTSLGMNTNKLGYHEETDLLLRAWATMPHLKVLYIPEASVQHAIRPEKVTFMWQVKSRWAKGWSSVMMRPLSKKQAIRCTLSGLKAFFYYLPLKLLHKPSTSLQGIIIGEIGYGIHELGRGTRGLITKTHSF